MAETGATAWRWLIAGEFRAFPMRFVLAGLAIAIGVALAFAVHVINRSAAESFGRAVRSAAGGADLQVRGASALGFDESLYPKLMAHSVVADASPVVQLRAIIGEQARPIPLLGLDIFRTQTVSQSLVIRPRLARIGAGTRSTDLDALLDQDALYLSRAAMTQTGLDVGHRVDVRANGRTHNFVMAGDLPGCGAGAGAGGYRHRVGAMALRTARHARSCRREAQARDRPCRRQGSALIDFACQHSAQRCRDREPARRRALARLSRQPRHARAGRAADRRVPRLFGAIACSHAAAAPVRAAPHARPAGTGARRPAAGRGCSPGRCGRVDWFGLEAMRSQVSRCTWSVAI